MPDTLSSYAQSQPDKLGVIDDKPDGTVVTWTYAELEAQSNRVANLLLRLGAGPGKKVLWCGPNSPEVVAVMTATRRIGAVAVPLNYRLTPEEALYVINHSDAEVVYVDHEHAPMFAGLRDRLEKVRHIVAVGGPAPDGMLADADIAAAPAGAPDVGDAAGAGGTMIYTSGTTGKPKGAVRAGGPDPELLGALLNLFGYRPDDIYITSGPLYHSGPSAFMGAGLLYGQTIIVQRHSDAEVAYVDYEHAPMFAGLRDRLEKVRHIIAVGGPVPDGMLTDADIAAAPAGAPDVGDAADAGGTMIYTSGTTGKPKGAVRAGGPDPELLGALLSLFGYRPDDIYITSGPLYHSGPGAFMGAGLLYGQTIIVQRRFDAEDWLRLVDKYKASSTFAAPALIRMICALPREVKDRYDRSSMRIMLANAAPWSYTLKQQYLADFPPRSLFEVYGSTELGVDTVLLPEDQMRKPGSCGKPAPGIDIMLVDADGNEVTGMGPDHPGEIFVRSKGTFDTYYKSDASYQASSRGDFHTVGDIAYRDDEGYLYICDRKTDVIISGGMNIYPAEIEAVLEQHPEIYDVAVFGIPSQDWGEAVHATVVRSPGSSLTGEEITAFAREHLASYKVPRSVEFTDELPRTGSGKLLKRQLRAPYWAGRTAQVG